MTTVKGRPGATSKISIHCSEVKHALLKQLRKRVDTEAVQASIQAVPETADCFGLVLKQLAGRDSFKAMKQLFIRRAMEGWVLHELRKQPHREGVEALVWKTSVHGGGFFDDLHRLAGDDVWNKIKNTKWRFKLRRPVCKVSRRPRWNKKLQLLKSSKP